MYIQVVARERLDINPNSYIKPISKMYYSQQECVDSEFGDNDPEGPDYLIVEFDDKGFYKVLFIWDKENGRWEGVA